MKRVILPLVLLTVTSSHAAAQDWTPEQAEVVDAIRAYEKAWNDGDADAMAALCTSDCNRIGALGQRFEGKEGIRSHYKAFFATPLAEGIKRSLAYEITSVRMISDGVAIADANYRLVGLGPRSDLTVDGLNTVVLVKQDGKWLRTAHRNSSPHAPQALEQVASDRDRFEPHAAPRIQPVAKDQWTAAQREFLQPLEQAGRLFNVFKTAARHPDLAKSFDAFATGHINGETSTLSPRDRELLILRTCWLCRCEYAWAHHSRIARSIGLTDDELDRIVEGADAEGWSPPEIALLRAVDELHGYRFIFEATWTTLSEDYSTQQVMDVVATVGTYNLVCMMLNSWGVQLDEGLTGYSGRSEQERN